MVAYTKPQKLNKEESEKLRGVGDKINFIDNRFERGQVAGFMKGKRRQDLCYFNLEMYMLLAH